MDVGGPQRFDPTGKDYWLVANVMSISSNRGREWPRMGEIVLEVCCYTSVQTNLYACSAFASEIAEHLDRKYLSVLDYEADEQDGVEVGYIRFKEPQIGREKPVQTWQEIRIMVKGEYSLDRASTIPILPTS